MDKQTNNNKCESEIRYNENDYCLITYDNATIGTPYYVHDQTNGGIDPKPRKLTSKGTATDPYYNFDDNNERYNTWMHLYLKKTSGGKSKKVNRKKSTRRKQRKARRKSYRRKH